MDANLNAVRQSLAAAASDLQTEIQTASQAQATQVALEMHRAIREVKLSLGKLQRDAERQIADDPNTTRQNTGITNLKSIKKSLAGLPDANYDAIAQEKAALGKPLTLDACHQVNPNAPPKTKGRSRIKEAQAKIAQLELENFRFRSEVATLRKENQELKEEVKQLRLQGI